MELLVVDLGDVGFAVASSLCPAEPFPTADDLEVLGQYLGELDLFDPTKRNGDQVIGEFGVLTQLRLELVG